MMENRNAPHRHARLTDANGTAERATALPCGGRSRKGADSLLRLALGHQLTVDGDK
jgi:hypothetical protein